MKSVSTLVTLCILATAALSQGNFRDVVEQRLKTEFQTDLKRVCAVDTDPVAGRIFREYGAIFVAKTGGPLPASCIFSNEAAVQAFQASVEIETVTIGGVPITLQKAAMKALHTARKESAVKGLSITPRGGSGASARSYATTLDLWKSRFNPALTHWVDKKRIKPNDADIARKSNIDDQVAMVLDWEDDGIFFSKDLSKSILYSVAIPGASQHNFMLALDVTQFADKRVRQILAKHGWFQTVKSDLPHFTFLGVSQQELPALGLRPVTVSGQEFWIPNM